MLANRILLLVSTYRNFYIPVVKLNEPLCPSTETFIYLETPYFLKAYQFQNLQLYIPHFREVEGLRVSIPIAWQGD